MYYSIYENYSDPISFDAHIDMHETLEEAKDHKMELVASRAEGGDRETMIEHENDFQIVPGPCDMDEMDEIASYWIEDSEEWRAGRRSSGTVYINICNEG